MNCKDNLHICKASCCKVLAFGDYALSEESKEYFRKRGCKLEQLPNRLWKVLVPHRCENLREDNLCEIHDNKPKMCERFDENNKKGFYITEGCILGK